MKGLILAGSLIGSVVAASHGRHQGFHNRRADYALSTGTPDDNICSVYTTYVTVVYGEPTLVQNSTTVAPTTPCSSTVLPVETSSSSSSSANSTSIFSSTSTPTPTPSSTSTPTPTPTPSTSEQPVAPSSYAAPSSTPEAYSAAVAAYDSPSSAAAPAPSASSSSNSGSYSGGVSTNGNKWAITYTPYDNSGQCKTASAVMSDLKQIAAKGFKAVRTYSTDCSGLQNIGAACEATGLQVILGVYISNTGVGGAQQQVQDIVQWGKFNLVQMIIVGNEAVFNKYTTVGELAGFISSARSAFRKAGYNGPVTTTEPQNIIQEIGSQLCDSIDVIGANIQTFFNSNISPASAGDFVVETLEGMEKICPGKKAYNLESGWPTGGSSNGLALVGKWAQKLAMQSILEKAGSVSVMFSFDNDAWKSPGSFGVEQFFGCLDIF